MQQAKTIAVKIGYKPGATETSMIKRFDIVGFVLLSIYKYTFCRDIRHCIGLCGKKWTAEEERKAVEESYKIWW